MRRKKRSSGLLKFCLLTLLFLIAVAGVILAAVFFAPDTPDTPPDGSVQNTATDTAGTSEDLSTEDSGIDRELLKALAASAYGDETFAAGYIAVYDLTADVMLYGKNATERITAASTTKLLTALTMLEYVSEDTVFTVGSELSMVGSGSSSAKLVKGQNLTVTQILNALLIPSGNDAAYVIAAHVGRNLSGDPQINDRDAVDLFLEKMNDKARAIGVKDSLFTCPDGYPDKKQYTTAEDMLLISVEAARNATIRQTVEQTYAEIVFPDGSIRGYVNTNQLMVPSSSYFYEGTFGMKTGSTPGAGSCLIAGAEAYGHELIVALFKAPDNATRYTDSQKVLNAGFEAVKQLEEEK